MVGESDANTPSEEKFIDSIEFQHPMSEISGRMKL